MIELHSELIQSHSKSGLDALVQATESRIRSSLRAPFWLFRFPVWDWKTGTYYYRVTAYDSEPERILGCPAAHYECVSEQQRH